MKKVTKIIIAIIILGIAGFWVLNNSSDFSKISSDTETYKNENYNFSFETGQGVTVGESIVDENNGETIIIKNVNIKNQNLEAQIYITPFDEDISLTAERIKQDIPDIKIKDEGIKKVDGISGVGFVDLDQNTKEVWFVKSGFLYQVSSDTASGEFTDKILSSWKWK